MDENYWIFSSFEHDKICGRRNEMMDGRAPMAYLSFPSLKDPKAKSHTAEIVAPFSYQSLEAFREEPWRRRGADYDSAKHRLTKALLDLVEQQFPGFRQSVAYFELATPLTFEYFTGAPSGTIYGYPGVPDRYRKTWLQPRTPVRNLYLTGTDATMLGIMGALMGGVVTASNMLGAAGFLEIMRSAAAFRAGGSKQRGPERVTS